MPFLYSLTCIPSPRILQHPTPFLYSLSYSLPLFILMCNSPFFIIFYPTSIPCSLWRPRQSHVSCNILYSFPFFLSYRVLRLSLRIALLPFILVHPIYILVLWAAILLLTYPTTSFSLPYLSYRFLYVNPSIILFYPTYIPFFRWRILQHPTPISLASVSFVCSSLRIILLPLSFYILHHFPPYDPPASSKYPTASYSLSFLSLLYPS